jgi:hypothetical protein
MSERLVKKDTPKKGEIQEGFLVADAFQKS